MITVLAVGFKCRHLRTYVIGTYICIYLICRVLSLLVEKVQANQKEIMECVEKIGMQRDASLHILQCFSYYCYIYIVWSLVFTELKEGTWVAVYF